MKATFWKGIVLGSVVSMTTLMATAAFAGTGIGSVFNLGSANRVNATTALTGSTNSAQLDVENANTGANARGIAIHTATNRPPLVVNSATQVNNLNANYLQGKSATAFTLGGGSIHGARLLDLALGSTTGLGPVAALGGLTAYCGFGVFAQAGLVYTASVDQDGQYVFGDGEAGYFSGSSTTIYIPDASTETMATFQIGTSAAETATMTILYGYNDVDMTCHFSVQVVDSVG